MRFAFHVYNKILLNINLSLRMLFRNDKARVFYLVFFIHSFFSLSNISLSQTRYQITILSADHMCMIIITLNLVCGCVNNLVEKFLMTFHYVQYRVLDSQTVRYIKNCSCNFTLIHLLLSFSNANVSVFKIDEQFLTILFQPFRVYYRILPFPICC